MTFGSKVYSKTCVKQPLLKRPKKVFKTNYRLMQVKSIEECSKGSILQYFRRSLGYHLSSRSLFCLFLVAILHRFTILKVCSTARNTSSSCAFDIGASYFGQKDNNSGCLGSKTTHPTF